MGASQVLSEKVEENWDLIQRCFQEALNALHSREEKLDRTQESVRESSEKLNSIRESLEERLKQVKEKEKAEKEFNLFVKNAFKELEVKNKELNFFRADAMVRIEKLQEQEKLIRGLFERMEMKGKELETLRKSIDQSLEEISAKERQSDDRSRELELIEIEMEIRQKEIEVKDNVLGLKEKELTAKENELEARKRGLCLKKEELVAKENKLEAREKSLDLRKELDSRKKVLDSIQRLKEQSNDRVRLNSRKRDDITINGSDNSPKRSRLENCCNSADCAMQAIVADVNESSPPDLDSKLHRQIHVELPRANNSNESDSVSSDSQSGSDSESPYYSRSLINDFRKEKLETLAAGQTWALYDNSYLPRTYIRILSVLDCHISGFVELQFAWLWPLPHYRCWKKSWKPTKRLNSHDCKQNWMKWISASLPVGCGVFERGKERTLCLPLHSFSAQVCCKDDRSPYLIYPSTGETWAIFEDWDIIRWTSNTENYRFCKYAIVEVLDRSSYGTKVAYLKMLAGSVSIFQRRRHGVKDPFVIEDTDLFRFSHKVPSFKMSGNEIHGVPAGAFELDPEALPAGL